MYDLCVRSKSGQLLFLSFAISSIHWDQLPFIEVILIKLNIKPSSAYYLFQKKQ